MLSAGLGDVHVARIEAMRADEYLSLENQALLALRVPMRAKCRAGLPR
jgi:hypothetical protein